MKQQIDSYGFLDQQMKPGPEFQALQNSRTQKWLKMLKKNKDITQSELLKSRIRKGIPQSVRTVVWPQLAQVTLFQKQYPNIIYENLLQQEVPEQLKKQFNTINDDVPRTFNNNIYFNNEKGCFIIAFPSIGYTQGLNFIAGIFLMHFDEEISFWMIVSFMFKYDRQQIFTNLEHLNQEIYIFQRLLIKYFPNIEIKFTQNNLSLTSLCTGWFLTNYATVLPFLSILNIFDIFLNEPEKILYRIGLAIFKHRLKRLKVANNVEKLMYCFKELENDPLMLPQSLLEEAFSFTFSRSQIKKYEKDYKVYKFEQDQINIQKQELYKQKMQEKRKQNQSVIDVQKLLVDNNQMQQSQKGHRRSITHTQVDQNKYQNQENNNKKRNSVDSNNQNLQNQINAINKEPNNQDNVIKNNQENVINNNQEIQFLKESSELKNVNNQQDSKNNSQSIIDIDLQNDICRDSLMVHNKSFTKDAGQKDGISGNTRPSENKYI